MRKSEEMEQRRAEALSDSTLPFFAEPPSLENMDAVPTSLTKEEREVLFIFLFRGAPLSAFNILGIYEGYRRECASQLYLQSIPTEQNIFEKVFIGSAKKFQPAVAPFKFEEKDMKTVNLFVRLKEKEWNDSHEEEDGTFAKRGVGYILNPVFLDKLAEEVLEIGILSYSKIRKILQNLQFLSLINEREDSDQRTKLYFLNPTFYSNWTKRRAEWAEKLNSKVLSVEDVGLELVWFYQLKNTPKDKERIVHMTMRSLGIEQYLILLKRKQFGAKPAIVSLLKKVG